MPRFDTKVTTNAFGHVRQITVAFDPAGQRPDMLEQLFYQVGGHGVPVAVVPDPPPSHEEMVAARRRLLALESALVEQG